MFKAMFVAACASALFACGDAVPGQAPLRGSMQKGPFVLGSSIVVSAVDAHGEPTGAVFATQTSDDSGVFALEIADAGLVSIEGTGFYFDEVTGALSTAPGTLRAFYDASAGTGDAHVNLVTHLTHDRIHALLATEDLASATAQAEGELRGALGIGPAGYAPSEDGTALDILGGDTDANAYLLAVSAVTIQAAVDEGGPLDATLQQLIDTLAAQLAATGGVSTALGGQVRAAEAALDPAAVLANVAARFPTATVPDLNRMIDSDLDGVMNDVDNCVHVANADQLDADVDGRGDPCSPAQILVASGGAQTVPAGGQLAPLVALVEDVGNRPVAGVTVAFTVVSGDGTLSAATAVTDAGGTAMTTLAMGPSTGAYEVDATVVGKPFAPAVFTATARYNTQSPVAFTTGGYTRAPLLADLDGDGRLDIVSCNAEVNTISIELNTTADHATAASFAGHVDVGTGRDPSALASGDLNGDGLADLVVSNANDGTVSVLLNTTTGPGAAPTFAPRADFATTGLTFSAVADVDGDGRPDLVLASGSAISILVNTTPAGARSASFAAHRDLAAPQVIGFAVTDLNQDGRPDLVVASATGNVAPNTLAVFLNTTTSSGAALAFAETDIAYSGYAYALAAGDLDGDGLPDLVMTGYIVNAAGDSGVLFALRNTTGAGATTPSFATSTVALPQPLASQWLPSVTLADLDRDGHLDVVVTPFVQPMTVVLRNSSLAGASTPTFDDPLDFWIDDFGMSSTTLGDLNGDGMADLVAAGQLQSTSDPGDVVVQLAR